MTHTLTGKTAFITGASKGIGYSIAEAFVAKGINVVITARTASDVEAAAEKLNQQGGAKALGIACDTNSDNKLN